MLGILHMDVQACIDEYLKLASKIFSTEGLLAKTSLIRISKLVVGEFRFRAEPLEQEVKELIRRGLESVSPEGGDASMLYESLSSGGAKCKV
jgi:hypothetical protein